MTKLKKLNSLIPIHELEQGAQGQIYAALELDFLLRLAIMPDCHTGYTLPIGGVALLHNVISPVYVGYDIGCGMCYILTDIKAHDFFKKDKHKIKMFNEIYEIVPVGFNSHVVDIPYKHFLSASGNKNLDKKVDSKLRVQLGTLGSGNHFIEIGENKDGFITITIHSGSRNIGHSIASYYIDLSTQVDIDLPNGFLHLNGEYGQQYLQDMKFALEYALENRKRMMQGVLSLFGYDRYETEKFIREIMVNENHNHAEADGNVVLHRKGATQANKGQIGIIPGNMKTGVYVTEGLGNELYLNSSSHGAGRKMSRKKAKKEITLDRFRSQMHGVIAKVGHSTKDEAPDAYKNIKDVIEMQEGIVIKTIDHSKPLINVKG